MMNAAFQEVVSAGDDSSHSRGKLQEMNATDYLQHLVRELASLPRETEWVEFKENNANPEEIGEYVSAIANSAALEGKQRGYIVWGVRDADHEIVGTVFRPSSEKVKGQELENWLAVGLRPSINFRIYEGIVDGQPVAVFEIPAAAHTPVRFGDFEYIRVGSYKKKLRDHPEKERQLWSILSAGSFESEIAHAGAAPADLIALLDHALILRASRSATTAQYGRDRAAICRRGSDRPAARRALRHSQRGRHPFRS